MVALTHRIDRFWIPVLPVLALLAGAGGCWMAERWWRRVLVAVLLAAAGANFLVASAGQGNAWFVSLARLRHQPGWIDPWHEYFNVHLSRGRLLAVGDAAVFDLLPPVLYNTCFDDCIFEQIVRGRTAAEIRRGVGGAASRLHLRRLGRDCPLSPQLRLYRFRSARGLHSARGRGYFGAVAAA